MRHEDVQFWAFLTGVLAGVSWCTAQPRAGHVQSGVSVHVGDAFYNMVRTGVGMKLQKGKSARVGMYAAFYDTSFATVSGAVDGAVLDVGLSCLGCWHRLLHTRLHALLLSLSTCGIAQALLSQLTTKPPVLLMLLSHCRCTCTGRINAACIP